MVYQGLTRCFIKLLGDLGFISQPNDDSCCCDCDEVNPDFNVKLEVYHVVDIVVHRMVNFLALVLLLLLILILLLILFLLLMFMLILM